LASLGSDVSKLLETIQSDMFSRAKKEYDERVVEVTDWKDFVPTLNAKKVCAVPWCQVEECEDEIKNRSAKESAEVQDERAPSAGAKSLCMPYDQTRFSKLGEAKTSKCPNCGRKATKWTLFGRSY